MSALALAMILLPVCWMYEMHNHKRGEYFSCLSCSKIYVNGSICRQLHNDNDLTMTKMDLAFYLCYLCLVTFSIDVQFLFAPFTISRCPRYTPIFQEFHLSSATWSSHSSSLIVLILYTMWVPSRDTIHQTFSFQSQTFMQPCILCLTFMPL